MIKRRGDGTFSLLKTSAFGAESCNNWCHGFTVFGKALLFERVIES